MSTEDILMLLSQNEATVLYWKSQGLNYVQIGNKLNFSVDWVTLQMGYVYRKLGFDKKMHWTKRAEILEKEVYPILLKLIENDPKKLKNFPMVIDVQTPEEPEKPKPPLPKKITDIVLYDEKMMVKAQNYPTIKYQPSKVRRGFSLLAFSIILLSVITVTGFFFYRLGLRSNPTIPSEALPLPLPTLGLDPTSINTLLPTETPIPTTAPLSTNTSSPTTTPLPINTTTSTITPNPNVFLFDDFRDGLDPVWAIVFGNPLIVNEQLTSSESTMLSIGDPSWTDYQIEFDVKGMGCNIVSDGDALGVRVADIDNLLLYIFSSCDAEWVFVIEGKKASVPGTHTRGFSSDHVTVRVEGNRFTVYRNSEQLVSLIEDGFSVGYIYLRIRSKTLYDNFKVVLLNP